MVASAAFAAMGTTFTWNANPVGELTQIGGSPNVTDLIEVTSHDSDNNYREFVPGLIDGGEIVLEGNFIPADAGQAGLLADMQARTKRAWIITYPNVDASTWTGNGYCTKFETTSPFDGKVGFSATVRITGKATFTV